MIPVIVVYRIPSVIFISLVLDNYTTFLIIYFLLLCVNCIKYEHNYYYYDILKATIQCELLGHHGDFLNPIDVTDPGSHTISATVTPPVNVCQNTQ